MVENSVIRVCHLADAAATAALGGWLARRLLKTPGSASKGTPLVLLQGELGAGKTCLVQGLAAGLGIAEPITSPSFALAQHYRGLLPTGPTALVHLDLYRLEQPAAADELFAQEEEEARAIGAVMAVEWPERLSFSPEEALVVQLVIEEEGRLARLLPPAAPLPGAGCTTLPI